MHGIFVIIQVMKKKEIKNENCIEYQGIRIPYHLKKSNRKTYGIYIAPGGVVTVKVPNRFHESFLRSFFVEKEVWIIKKYQESLTLEKMEEEWDVHPKSKERIVLENRYKNAAREYIPKRVEHYATLIGVSYAKISIRDQKTRWGSCSSSGMLSFNYKLIMAPPRVLDYIVVHELCHRIEMNHSKAFWNLVEEVIPEYKEYQHWLKINGKTFYRKFLQATE